MRINTNTSQTIFSLYGKDCDKIFVINHDELDAHVYRFYDNESVKICKAILSVSEYQPNVKEFLETNLGKDDKTNYWVSWKVFRDVENFRTEYKAILVINNPKYAALFRLSFL